MDQEKMHGVLQKSHSHVQIVSDSGNASLLMKSSYWNNFRNSEDQARSVFLGISNHRCAVLTFLTLESDGTWRVVAVPLQYPELRGHLLFGHINVDRLHPIFGQPINASNHNRRKAQKGPQGGGSLLMHSSTVRKSIQSDARCQSHRKALPNKPFAKYSACNYGLNSSTSDCDPRLLQGDTYANDSTAELTDGDKADKGMSKILRNKGIRKGKHRKRPPFNGGSRGLEVLAEDFDSGSSISRTYGMKNEVDGEGTVPCGTGSELQLKAAIVPKNCADDEKSEGIDCSEAPQTSISNSYGRDTSETAATPFVWNTLGENNGHEFKGDSRGRCAEMRQEDLDSSIIMPLVVPCCDNKVNKLESNSSCACKMGSVGNSHQHAGKGNSYPVWQKVQQKHDQECIDDDTKKLCSTESKIDTSWRKASLLKQNGRVAEGNMEFRNENKQQPHPEFSHKLKRKGFLDSKVESDVYSTKGSFTNKAKLEKSGTSTKIRPYTKKTAMPSQVNQNEGETESKSVSQNPPRTVYSVAPILDNEDAKYDDSSLPVYCTQSNHVNYSEFQSSASVPHLLADEISLLGKKVSVADGSKQRCSSGSFTQKWVPVRMKNPLSTDPIRSESCLGHSCDATVEDRTLLFPKDKIGSKDGNDIETGVACRFEESRKENYPPCDDESQVEPLTNEKSCMLMEHKLVPHSFSRKESENQKSSAVQIHLDKITRAIQEAYRIQLASEAVCLVTGGPIAEFERLLCFSSPVLCQSRVTAGCNTCPRDRVVGSLLCQHERPNVSLECLWQWYKKHTSYGLEVRGEDYINSSRIGVDRFAFRAYFVPYLSAVQLFKKCSSGSACSINGVPRSELEFNERSEKSVLSGLPMFSLLVPQACNGGAGNYLHTNEVSTCQSSPSSGNSMSSPYEQFKDLELLFEYFEVEQPQQRQPLYDKIQELVGVCGPSHSRVYGDPSELNSANLCDLDPRSWYSVAWYPIYRIPDGNFRAAFLTYHSLGNLVRREATFDSVNVNPCVVSPVVGLQSYNCQSECWFQLKPSALSQRKEVSSLDPSKILRERLRTLEEVASLMATAPVAKGDCTTVNRQPDYEFFLSRRR